MHHYRQGFINLHEQDVITWTVTEPYVPKTIKSFQWMTEWDSQRDFDEWDNELIGWMNGD